MKRRHALETVGTGLVGLSLAPRLFAEAPAPKRKRHWVWITADAEYDDEGWKRVFDRMRAAGIDAVIPEVYKGRHAHWASTHLPVKDDRLGRLLPLAKAAGLEVHAWMWTMPCLIEDVLQKHPDWYSVNARGESAGDKPAYVDYYKFLDPARPEVREFVQRTVKELAAIDGLTGIHLDYVRHPDAILPKGLWGKYKLVQDRVYPEFDYGYSAYSREQFKKKHGIDPKDIEDPSAHAAWMQYRWDSVTDLVNDYLVPAAKAGGKQATAAVFPGPTLARSMVRQDWGRWKLDGFLPMLYRTFYEAGPEWVTAQAREGAAAVSAPVYAGLFAVALDAPALATDVRAAFDGGAAGVSLFESKTMSEEKWKALEGALGGGGGA
jgi:uncharacterized lipoprotein YddW (UPF0748 family)